MQAGQLDRKIALKTFTTTKDSWNYDVKTYETFAEVWARRVDKRPSEETEAMATEAITRTEWWIRYTSGITRTMEIHYGGDVWDITGIQEMGRNEWLILTSEMREKE